MIIESTPSPREAETRWTREQADAKIEELESMSTSELVQLWAILFGTVCYTRRKAFIRRRLEWRINTLVSGGISERAMKRAEELADDTRLRLKSRAFRERESTYKQPAADFRITRRYKGKEHVVFCRNGSFLYNGREYATLSEVSTLITGYYCSGNKFFNITQQQLNNLSK